MLTSNAVLLYTNIFAWYFGATINEIVTLVHQFGVVLRMAVAVVVNLFNFISVGSWCVYVCVLVTGNSITISFCCISNICAVGKEIHFHGFLRLRVDATRVLGNKTLI